MLISLLVILILTLLLFVALFQSIKSWSWTNIIFVFLVFVMSIVGGYAASQTLKARSAWMLRAKENVRIAEENKAKYEVELNGPPQSLEFTKDSLRGAEFEWDRATVGVGRVWTEGTVSKDAENAVIQFESATGDGAAQLVEETVVFAFSEQLTDTTPPFKVAGAFIGTFRVSAMNGNQATLIPLVLSNEGKVELETPQSSWSLFEKMPVDKRDAFKVHARIDTDDDEFDVSAYRELLISDYLPANTMGLDPASKEYEGLIDSYAFDGLQMGKIKNWIANQTGRLINEFDPGDENLHVQLRFTSSSSPFKVDGAGNASENAFNQQGQAVDASLHYGSDISFQKDDIIKVTKLAGVLGYEYKDSDLSPIVIPPLTQTLPVERIGGDDADIYVRPLKNYPHLLTEAIQQIETFDKELIQITSTTAITDQALAEAMTQQGTRNSKLNDLEADLDNYKADLAVVTSRSTEIAAELSRQKSLIQTYYKQVLKMQEDIMDSN